MKNEKRIPENKRKIKQIPDKRTLSGISFFWQFIFFGRLQQGIQVK